jgi:hypothetical protein
MINARGAVGGMRIGRGTEVLEENPPQCHFAHHKFHMTWHTIEPGSQGGKPVANRLSCDRPIISFYINNLSLI